MDHELTDTCIICGSPSLPGRVCDQCNSNKCSGRKFPIPDIATKGTLKLAGAVIRLCLNEYKAAYRRTFENPYRKMYRDEFELLDKKFRTGYYQILSYGHMDALLDKTRHEVEREVGKCPTNRSGRRNG